MRNGYDAYALYQSSKEQSRKENSSPCIMRHEGERTVKVPQIIISVTNSVVFGGLF